MNTDAFFEMSYGLYIVTASHDATDNGYIANTAFQVTADPPQFGVSSHKNNYTTQLIDRSRKFAICILQQDTDMRFIGRFGFKSGETNSKLEGLNYERGITGAPLIVDNTVACIECEVKQVIDGGTHLLFLGQAVNTVVFEPEKTPLTYRHYREVIKGRTPKNATTYVPRQKM